MSGPAPGSDLADVIDLDRYPVHEPDGAAYAALVADVRADLAATGCRVLAGFLRPAVRERLRAECAALAPSAHVDVETVNVYNSADPGAFPAGHPGRALLERGNAFVPRDRIPGDSLIARLYADAAVQRLVGDCFGLAEVHELADPLSALVLNIVLPGRGHPWHFDVNEFTVSMLTCASSAGGAFEYCPDIRSAHDENLDAVAAVLAGRAPERVRALDLCPGDLQLFRGRYALHRVTPVAGTPRHSAIFAYSARPGVVGSPARTRQLFGRVTDRHLAAAGERVDERLD